MQTSPFGLRCLPVLSRGLNDPAQDTKQTCCVIVGDMLNIADHPAAIIPVVPKLDPLVKAVGEKSYKLH